MNYYIWFKRIELLGVASNLVLAVWALFAPGVLLKTFGLNAAYPETWVQFSALLLIIVSLFYIPGALNPERDFSIAILSIISRAMGVLFFIVMVFILGRQKHFLIFSAFDFLFGLSEAVLLTLGRKNAYTPSSSEGQRE